MTAHFDDLVREAQERFAERAVHPDRIRAALPARAARRARHRRYGALASVAAAVLAAGAVAVPVLGLRGHGAGPGLGYGAPPPSTVASAPAATGWSVPLRYRPTWLPAGLTERIRRMPLGSGTKADFVGLTRTWTNRTVGTDGNGSDGLSITVYRPVKPTEPEANGGTPVDINGTTGYYHDAGVKSYLEWRAGTDAVVSINQLRVNLSQADMLRVARSVRPDTTSMAVPLRLGWLPSGVVVGNGEVSGDSPAGWYARVSAEEPVTAPPSGAPGKQAKDGKQSPRDIDVILSPTTTAPAGGTHLTVAGHPARLVTRTDLPGLNMKYLVVEFGGGQLLTIVGQWPDAHPLTQDDLVHVAEKVAWANPADVTWIGSR